MKVLNQTTISKFVLLGFQQFQTFKAFFFFFFLVFHLMTICGNLLIIWLVASNRSLQSPMYFFLTQLSLSDLLLTTDIVPNALYIIWNEGGVMSFSECLSQFCLFATSESSECFILSIMAYDRYLAVCKPLRYNAIMSPFLCMKFVAISWLLSFCVALVDIISLTQLQFCGPNVIDHFFCDLSPLLELSCSDTHFFDVEALFFSIPLFISPFLIVTVSYACIVQAVLKISTKTGRGKAFSTCSSHLAVVCIFYGTLVGSYTIPSKGKLLTVSKAVSMLYTVFTPFINPIIYSLKNKDISGAITKRFRKTKEHFCKYICN